MQWDLLPHQPGAFLHLQSVCCAHTDLQSFSAALGLDEHIPMFQCCTRRAQVFRNDVKVRTGCVLSQAGTPARNNSFQQHATTANERPEHQPAMFAHCAGSILFERKKEEWLEACFIDCLPYEALGG